MKPQPAEFDEWIAELRTIDAPWAARLRDWLEDQAPRERHARRNAHLRVLYWQLSPATSVRGRAHWLKQQIDEFRLARKYLQWKSARLLPANPVERELLAVFDADGGFVVLSEERLTALCRKKVNTFQYTE